MSRTVRVILIYHRHKPIDVVVDCLFIVLNRKAIPVTGRGGL
jgi:hypothetical protein